MRAGLELIAAVAGLKTSAPLQTRVGIATGLVVVGDLIGSGEAQEQAVVGETPNLAARLQAAASRTPSPSIKRTHRLLGGLFEYRDLGGIEAEGLRRTGASIRGGAPRAWSRAGSRRCARRPRRWSAATRKSICSCGAGSRQRVATVAWC